MSLKNEIALAKIGAKEYKLEEIEHFELDIAYIRFKFSCLEPDQNSLYFLSYTQFGEWVKNKQLKIGDKIKIYTNQANEVEFAEIP